MDELGQPLYDLALSIEVSCEQLIEVVRKTIHFRSNDPKIHCSHFDTDSILEAEYDFAFRWFLRPGEFPLMLSLTYPFAPPDFSWEDWTKRVCSELNCSALISDDDINPYSWFLVDVYGQFRKVKIDSEYFELTGGYALVKRDVV